MRFTDFDTRGYPTVDVRTGYAGWVGTYEDTVQDAMDIALLDRLSEPSWSTVDRAVDLGCGTGRTGKWLRDNGVRAIDGVDLTPEMLAVAAGRGAHDKLVEADVTDTGLPAGGYDLLIASLVDEHLDDLRPLYAEAARLAAPGAVFVLVAFHPQFMMVSGMPTHYTDEGGEHVAISTNVHLVSDHVTAGLAAGWRLAEMRERLIDEEWVALKPKWRRYAGQPVSAAYVWRRV
ncbi:methyltransferase family protein [Herbihabitans rhizosphaerae]|uniref:Methyltransferase family protein n=1 Tax=Herbihabitans rhizosphaerae TaxID=1872711 RepID=A0A4Q7KQH4_9PSEU|nr:class I SAM-dependent methyltransferase [Herbihabitans rhizosphaerae]RZS37562.1 methyltransferase family protein [Herbihabitans rhizosphaerae]